MRSPSPNRRAPAIQNNSLGSERSIFCAWCQENRQTDIHNTKGCELFHAANVADQWSVTKNHGICVLCLEGQHSVFRCPARTRDTKKCEQCRLTHSDDLGSSPIPGSPKPQRVNRILERPNYSRTCPVVLSHLQARQLIIGLAILDDQSSITLMSPHVIQKLSLIHI